jgi:hypothetical protein
MDQRYPQDFSREISNKNICLKMGKRARLYYKFFPKNGKDRYISEYEIEFIK